MEKTQYFDDLNELVVHVQSLGISAKERFNYDFFFNHMKEASTKENEFILFLRYKDEIVAKYIIDEIFLTKAMEKLSFRDETFIGTFKIHNDQIVFTTPQAYFNFDFDDSQCFYLKELGEFVENYQGDIAFADYSGEFQRIIREHFKTYETLVLQPYSTPAFLWGTKDGEKTLIRSVS